MSKNSENYFSSKTKRRILLHFDFVEKVLLIKFVNFVNLRIGMAYTDMYLFTNNNPYIVQIFEAENDF